MSTNDSFLLNPGFQFSAALDPHRRRAYERALRDAVASFDGQPSVALVGWQAATLIDVVAGKASRVVVIEDDEELAGHIHDGFVAKGFGTNVSIVRESPETAHLDEKVDIVVAGLTSTWLMEGPAARILDNARRNLMKSDGAMIPHRLVHLMELSSAATEVNGIPLRVPRYSRPSEPIPVLGESKHWATSELDAGGELTLEVEDTIIVYPLLSGTLTGLRLTTLCQFGPNNVQPASHSGFQSLFVPLREDVEVTAGKPVEIFVRYRMGDGLTLSRFSARILSEASTDDKALDSEAVERFRKRIVGLIQMLDETGRGQDLDKVVSYTIDPHGDVSRLAALFWTVDEEFRRPLKELVEGFRADAAKAGHTPEDEAVYEIMLSTYQEARAGR